MEHDNATEMEDDDYYATTMEDDDDYFGFEGYVPQTVHPGNTLIIASLIFCILTTIMIPMFVAYLKNYERRQNNKSQTPPAEEEQSLAPEESKAAELESNIGPSMSSFSKSAISCDSVFTTTSSLLSHPRIRPSTRRRKLRGQKRAVRAQEMKEEMNEFASTAAAAALPTFDATLEAVDENTVSDGGNPTRASVSPSKRSSGPTTDSEESSNSSSSGSSSSESSSNRGFKKKFLEIVKFDHEMKRIFQLGLPFAGQALISGILEVVGTAVIGKLLGTRELAACVTVSMCLYLTADVLGGINESLATLCSQAIGAGNRKLAGQYVQLSLIFHTTLAIPAVIFWWIYIGPVILWFGFDEETVEIGKEYAYIVMVDLFTITAVSESIHGLLDVCDREQYSMIIGVSEEITSLAAIVIAATAGSPSLQDIALIEFGIGTFFTIFNIAFIAWKGWFKKYYDGMLWSFALYNTKAACLMFKQSAALSVGMVATEGEWEILSIFASILGPAEVVAWGVLGTIWGFVEFLTESIGDASEVRCAFLLGSGQPEKAQLSANKSIFIGVVVALTLTAAVFICQDYIPTWLTNDPTLQFMIADTLPLLGLATMSGTIASISYVLIGAQGRYTLATAIAIAASVFVTLPIGAVFSMVFNINLQGQTMAVVIGDMVTGSILNCLVILTDWKAISDKVIADNRDDDSSVSSSSDSSSDDSSSASSSKNSSSNSKRSKETLQPSLPKILESEPDETPSVPLKKSGRSSAKSSTSETRSSTSRPSSRRVQPITSSSSSTQSKASRRSSRHAPARNRVPTGNGGSNSFSTCSNTTRRSSQNAPTINTLQGRVQFVKDGNTIKAILDKDTEQATSSVSTVNIAPDCITEEVVTTRTSKSIEIALGDELAYLDADNATSGDLNSIWDQIHKL